MPGSAESAPNRHHRPEARRRAGLLPRSGQQSRESWKVKVFLPSIARFGRLAYPLLGEVTNRDMRGRNNHGCPVQGNSMKTPISEQERPSLRRIGLACRRYPRRSLRPCLAAASQQQRKRIISQAPSFTIQIVSPTCQSTRSTHDCYR